jgi:hypothetical protein
MVGGLTIDADNYDLRRRGFCAAQSKEETKPGVFLKLVCKIEKTGDHPDGRDEQCKENGFA